MKINNQNIGNSKEPFLIAEIGINHNGDMQIAKRLMDATFACGWQCVKFQKRTPEICVPEHQKATLRNTPWGEMTYLNYKHKIEFNTPEYNYINNYCKEKPLLWTASVWDIPSLNFLINYNIPFIKIPSAKLTDHTLLTLAAKSNTPIILSTGMSTIEEIDNAVFILETYSKDNYILMHTNSTYPTPPEDINLSIIPFLKERYNCPVGYSGHEYDLEPTVIAVSLGASIIERHITLDHNMWGTDQSASLEIHAMDMLRKRIDEVNIVLGNGVKKLTVKEAEIKNKLR